MAAEIGLNMRKMADKFNHMILSKKNPSQSELHKRATLLSRDLLPIAGGSFGVAKNVVELPDDVLNTIIESYLDLRSTFNLRSTCKRFYFLCSDARLFRRVDLQPYWSLVNDEFIEVLGCIADELEMIDLSWTKLTDLTIIEK
jgi:hypothetical protein